MDFEKAYEKFLNGTATPEETEFVRSEMKKASEINDILTSDKSVTLLDGFKNSTAVFDYCKNCGFVQTRLLKGKTK